MTAAQEEPFLIVDNLSKRYGNVTAVRNFSLRADRGDFVVIVGPSGCGKSTVLRLIAGLAAPTSGIVRLAHRNITDIPPSKRDVAMVFQDYALYPHLTVLGNLEFPLKMRRVPRKQRRAEAVAVAERLAIGDILDRHPSQLSGGQQQRVAIGRALVRKPHLFLMDEPLSNLDAHLRLSFRSQFRRIAAETAVPIVYVTHDPAEAFALATKMVVMENGAIIQIGDPREIIDHPQGSFLPAFLAALEENSSLL